MSKCILLAGFITFAVTAQAQIVSDTAQPQFYWTVPVAHFPFDRDAARTEANRRVDGNAQPRAAPTAGDYLRKYHNLSMQQGTDMSRNLHGTLYYVNNRFWYKRVPPAKKGKYFLNRALANVTALGLDVLAIKLPYGYAYQHEEFHRSVMSTHGIYSYDEVWNFGKGLNIAVTHVKDDDLVYLKDRHPAAQVRLAAAGVEGEYFFFQAMRKDNFFRQTAYPFVGLSILGTVHAVNYVNLPLKSHFNRITDSILVRDQQNILARDFTGYDFSAWVYDLFTPQEPYAARGTWPGGVGIKRPVHEKQLTPEMKAFLKKTGRLQYLNFLSPFNVGINRIRLGHFYGNFALRSVPTSFGYFAGGDVFVESDRHKFLVSAGVNQSRSLSLPDLGVQYFDFGLMERLTADLGFSVWLQPKDQLFSAKRALPGGAVTFQPRYRLTSKVWLAGGLKYKTAGWQFGEEYLDEKVSGRLQVRIES